MGSEPERQCVIPIHKPSNRELTFFFVSGILVSVPMALFFSNFYPFLPVLLSTVLLAPFIEELAKVFPLFYRHGETERSIVTLGALTGLGFGISEFVEYVYFFHVPFIERIPGIIFHVSSASITSYGIAKKNPWPYYLVSVTLHATNNYIALAASSVNTSVLEYLFISDLLILITAYYLAYHFYQNSSKEKIVV
jgi:RsiW-degrading membrane proteinase PrsW (M82 family)